MSCWKVIFLNFFQQKTKQKYVVELLFICPYWGRKSIYLGICLPTYVVCTCLCHRMPTSACLLYFLLFVLDEKILWSESRIVTTKLELVYLIEGSDFNAIQNHIIISFRSSILASTTKVICIWEHKLNHEFNLLGGPFRFEA